MNKLFITLVLLLSMAFGSLFYLAKCGGGDFAAGLAVGAIGTTVINESTRERPEVVVVEGSSETSEARIESLEEQVVELRKTVRDLENRVADLESK